MTEGWSQSKPAAPAGGRSSVPDELRDASRGTRLQKILAEAGVGSRRACEALIESGEVTVNGHVIDSLPIWVSPDKDHISVRGKKLNLHQPLVYVMLFKERGVVCTNSDPQGRRRAIDCVKHPSKARIFPVGRLDLESSGLLLLTNDGEMANRATHPRHGMHKSYEVTVDGALDGKDIERLRRGLYITDHRSPNGPKAKRTAESALRILKRDRDRTRLLMELHEGRNRQIRRMMAQLGHPVRKLRRIQMGPLKLKGLRPGQWRDLEPDEIKSLRRSVGLDR